MDGNIYLKIMRIIPPAYMHFCAGNSLVFVFRETGQIVFRNPASR